MSIIRQGPPPNETRWALESTLEARYRAAVEENVRLTTTRNELANEVARLSSDLTDVRADLVNAGRVTEELTQERNGLIEAVRLHLEEHTETARERDEAIAERERVRQLGIDCLNHANTEREAAIAGNVDAHRYMKEALLDLLTAREAIKRALRVLDGQPADVDALLRAGLATGGYEGKMVVDRADYEALVKALPATSPGLKVVRQCSAQIINRSTGGHSTCALPAGHEGMHLDETRAPG